MKKLAFVLFKYFPYGGLQRDMLKIARHCQEQGCEITVFTMKWDGPRPTGINVVELGEKGFTNIGAVTNFVRDFQLNIAREKFAGVVGFNKMPGLDIYYAADICFSREVRENRHPWFRLTRRCRGYLNLEQKVLAPPSKTRVLTISPYQIKDFRRCHHTEDDRMFLLPPGVDKKFRRPKDYQKVRCQIRESMGLQGEEKLLLQIGSGFRTKGLKRSMKAIASLPSEERRRLKFKVIGRDRNRGYQRLAETLKINHITEFLPPREDLETCLFAADLLLHPSLRESAGMVLLEAMTAGVPVICSGVCGYADYINKAQAGIVLPEPFSQKTFNETLNSMLNAGKLEEYSRRGQLFAEENDIYSLHQTAADWILQWTS